jgi:hypothetical protein
MSFGRNPHVAKAEAAEQKAHDARDSAAHELAWRDAARQWDRAAQREKSEKMRREFTDKAEAARARADAPRELDAEESEVEVEIEEQPATLAPSRSKQLN